MKKKIINGILMVALVGATSTSFVSCKDTSEDVKTDLMAQVNAVKAKLEPRVEQAEKDIYALERAHERDSIRLDGHDADIKYLKTSLVGVRDTLQKLTSHADSIDKVTKRLEGRMNVVEYKINTIVEALTKMVTSVNVNATSTNMLQNSKLFPGINAQFLGAAYGQAVNPFTFPSTDADDYIAYHGVVLTKNDIKDVKGNITTEASKPNTYLPVEEAAAGTIWFTLNPSNVDVKNLENLKLVDSQGNESFVTINKDEAVLDDETVLTWGITRAESPVKLWKAEAKIDFEGADAKAIDPTKIIDFKAYSDNFTSLFDEAYSAAVEANRYNYTTVAKNAAKEFIKSSAAIVATMLQTDIPNLPALALKAEWKDTVGTRSVLSDYSIAATAYKPLGFGFGDLGIKGRTFDFDRIDDVADRIVEYVKAKIPTYEYIEVKEINLTNQTVWISTGTASVTIPFSSINAQVNDALDLVELNLTIKELQHALKSAKSYADRAKNFEVRVSTFLEKQLNRVIDKLAKDGLTRALEPVMLYQGSEGVKRMGNGLTFQEGEYDLIPTTMTYEIIAPAYKKYVAIIDKAGKARYAEIKTNGQKDFKKFTVNLQEGDQAIVYDALDFSGKQIAKKYSINVVK
jgi:archaellum component FlaC